MRARNNNIQLQVCTTVNVFNVCYLEGVANWIDTQDFNFVYWNMMHDAPYFSISTLPTEAKKGVSNKLIFANVSPKHKQEFVNIMDFMNNGRSSDGRELREQIAKVDRRRNENLAVVAPEFAKLIGYSNE